MKSKLLGWLTGWLLFAAVCAFADGGFIAATAFAKVQIPDQRALIHFENGTETLVIDTAFKGEGTNFAWIVPVPSVPKIEAATRGLFPTLQTLFRPNVEHNVPRVFIFALSLGFIIATFIWRMRSGGSLLVVLLFWTLLMILVGLLLPAVTTAGVSASSTGQPVNVIDRKTVGIYDTATLSSKDGSALVDWLGQNGFATPTNFLPAIRAYAAEGWVFVASKVLLDSAVTEGVKAHPLILKFQTQKPVYPLRLTGIRNESCKIEIYVFGSGRAQVPKFEVERCAQIVYPNPTNNWHQVFGAIVANHPLLRRLVESSPVGTKLSARLNSEQMKEDAYIAWESYVPKQLTYYSKHGAAIFAANYVVPFVVLGLLGDIATVGRKKRWAKKVCKTSLLMALIAALCWIPIYLSLTKVEVYVAWRPSIMNRMVHRLVSQNLLIRWHDLDLGKTKPDMGWFREHLKDPNLWKESSSRTGQTNLFSGQLYREEDSPGNYILRDKGAEIQYVGFDVYGAEQVETLWENH